MADASRHALYSIAEVTYGTTPSTPAFDNLRHTGTTLALTKEGFQSEELQADRQVRDFRHGAKQTGGDVSIELSYGSFDDYLEALLGGTWDADSPSVGIDALKAGTTRRSFSVLRDFSDITTGRYHLFTGQEVNGMSLSVPTSAMVTGSFSLIGKGMTSTSSAPASSTFNAASTTSPFDSFSGSITEGGSAIATVTGIELSVENNIQPRFVIGSDETIRPSIGRINVSGTMTAFFEDDTLLQKFLAETESSVVFSLADAAGNDLEFRLPRIKYNGGQPDVSGEGPISLSLPFQALYDSTDATTIEIRRTAA